MAGLVDAAHRALAEPIENDVAIEDEVALPAVEQAGRLVLGDQPLLDQDGGQSDGVARITAVIDGGLDLAALAGQKELGTSKCLHKFRERSMIHRLEVWTSHRRARATLADSGQRAHFASLHRQPAPDVRGATPATYGYSSSRSARRDESTGRCRARFRRALAIHEQSYGPDDPDVATDLNTLAALLCATNRLGEAEPLLRRSVQILIEFQRRTGHEHPNFRVLLLDNYVGLLKEMGADFRPDRAAVARADPAVAAQDFLAPRLV